MDIKITNHTGDILGDYAVKNIMNYYQNDNQQNIINSITKLISEIKKSSIDNKDILIENLQTKTDNPPKLKEYLESLVDISDISSNVMDVIQSLGV